MKILLTGARGGVAPAVADALQKAGHQLLRADLKDGTNLRCAQTCRQLAGQVQAIVHLATLGADHEEVEANDLEVGQNLIEAATQHNLDRFLFFSSINVFGQGHWKRSKEVFEPATLPIDQATPCFPEDPYARAKLMIEAALAQSGLRHYSLRLPALWHAPHTRAYRPGWCGPLSALNVIDPWNYLDIRDLCRAVTLYMGHPDPPSGVSYLTAADTTRPEPTMRLLERGLPRWVEKWSLPPATAHSPWFCSRAFAETFGWRARYSWRSLWKRLFP